MKQTAVQWLQEQLNPNLKTMQGHIIQDLIEQAKAIEKEQIEDAYDDGANERHNGPINGQDYYNETYGGEQ